MWRSCLFVPVLEERFVAKAADRGADAVVLDLEASIPLGRKREARAALEAAIETLRGETDLTVRINTCWIEAFRDLEAAVAPGVSALHLAGCRSAAEVTAIDGAVRELERERDLLPGGMALIAILESPGAVLDAREIASASPRLVALTLGIEDYATEMHADATAALLEPAALQTVQAARATGLAPLVVPFSIAAFRDLAGFEAAAMRARAMGSQGGYAVHPGQVEVLNRVFTPSEDEIAEARCIVAAADAAERSGRGVVEVESRMIDKPLVRRARRLLAPKHGTRDGGAGDRRG